MKKLLALTLSLLMVFALVPMTMVSAEGTVAKIGDAEYASLFGADGALANAVAGDRIVMVANEEYTYTATHRGTEIYLNKDITLDLAGYSVTATQSGSTEYTFISTNAPLTIVSTVDGLGVENTATKGIFSAKATVVYTTASFTAENIELRSSLTGDSYGMALQVGATTTVNVKDCVVYAGKQAMRVSGGAPVFDVQDSTIYSQFYPLRGSGFNGTFKNCTIYGTNSYGPEITVGELTFDNCKLYVDGYDQFVIALLGGKLNLVNGTTIDAKGKAKYPIRLSTATAVLETSNATIKGSKNGNGNYAIHFANAGATAILGGGTVISASGNVLNANVNLYPFVKDGYALYSSAEASEDTLIAEDYDYTAQKSTLYVLEALATEPVIPVTTDEAASIRLNAKNGIRFYTAFDQEAIDALNVDGEAVEFGTIIAPADVIVDEFTHEDDHVDVKYEADEYWNGNEFVGSIVDIKEANIGREFVGRGYVKIGDTYYYSETTSTRSLKGIAAAYAAEGYPGATEDQKALVDSWANA